MTGIESKARAIFFDALDLESPRDLQGFLEKSCGTDRPLRQRVNELLRSHHDAEHFLDGVFDTGDMTRVFVAGQYEDGIRGNSTWSTGDWNGDGDFDSGVLIAAFSDGGYEAGARAAVSAVPEPSSAVLLGLGMLGLAARRRSSANPQH